MVCDGLKGLPDAVNAVWSDAAVQTCIIQLIRNSLGYVSRRFRDELSRDLRPICTPSSQKAAWILRSPGASVPLPGEPLFSGGLSHHSAAV